MSSNLLLLVEDEFISQRVIKSLLAKFGYQVDVAINGSDALKALEENDYALVLMDCMMPVLNGYGATIAIRDQTSAVRNHAIPVIALTANAFREDRVKCLKAGMNDYLSKPLDVSRLLAILMKWAPLDAAHTTNYGQTEANDSQYGGSISSIFDMEEFVRRNLGDTELSCEVATIFIADRADYMDSIRTALTAQDTAALHQFAHKLKGAAANLSLSALSECARRIETAAGDFNLENAGQLLIELEQCFDQAVYVLRKTLLTTQGKADT